MKYNFILFPISDQHLNLSFSAVVTWYQGLHSWLKKMKTNQELMAELLQVFLRYQKNLTTLLEHHELLTHLSVGKKWGSNMKWLVT
jgi:hypothetical protein